MRFEKYHGLGNDFVIVDQSELPVALGDEGALSRFSRHVCDRHRGIGADGLLVAVPQPGDAVPAMHVSNADGSVPEMCGNGLRCFARWLVDGGRARRHEALSVATGAGALACVVGDHGDVRIEMGRARFDPSFVPTTAQTESVELRLDAVELSAHCVSTGNPHAVIHSKRPLEDARRFGAAITVHRVFPEGANVEFVRVLDDHTVELVVWERGCGITEACGTGACATVASLARKDARWFGRDVEVRLPGGVLHVTVSDDWSMTMKGPTCHVFSGDWHAP